MSPTRILISVFILAALLVLCAGCTQQADTQVKTTSTAAAVSQSTAGTTTSAAPVVTAAPVPVDAWKRVRLETNKGNITIALNPAMPVTAGNFETLVRKGYYNGVIFHRVIDGFMIQGGDPTGTGRGNPGYFIKDEFTSGNHNNRGTIAMANAGPNTGGSQFFINLVDNNNLDTKHPVFGTVVDGMDVVDTIGKVPTTGMNGGNRPLQNVTIIRAEMV